MTQDSEYASGEQLRNDRELFSSLLKHIVQSAPSEDPHRFRPFLDWQERWGGSLLRLSVLGPRQDLHVHKHA